jgi:hypothetical protein
VNVNAALSAAGDDQQKAAPLGLFVLLLMGVGCYFLFKSMSRHLKRVREDFPVRSSAVPTPTNTPGSAPAARASDDGSTLPNLEPDAADGAADGEHLRPH